MKKSIFILAALFAATSVNAQITLEQTLNGYFTIHSGGTVSNGYGSTYHDLNTDIDFPFYYEIDWDADNNPELTLVNAYDYCIYKTITFDYSSIVGIASQTYGGCIAILTYNILAPNKAAFIININDYCGPGSNYIEKGMFIVDEDGVVLKKFLSTDEYRSINIVKVGNEYKLLVYRGSVSHAPRRERKQSMESYTFTEIYSLPGDGSTQTISAPSSSKRSSSARKIARDGQVLVETGNSTYALTGQEIK